MLAAVITGDIINSTENIQFLDKLWQVLKDIAKEFHLPRNSVEVYRGDSFQCLIEKPEDALLIAILIRAALRSKTYYKKFPISLDAKIAIGVGNVSSKGKKPGESTGAAFLLSGRQLDELNGKKFNMAIQMDSAGMEALADTVMRFIDDIIENWSEASAETACYEWFERLNQEQLAERLGISQPAVNKRRHVARISLLENADKNFRIAIQNLSK